MKSRWDGVNQWQVIQSGGLTPEVKLFVAEKKSLFSLQGEKGDGGEYGGGGRRDYK